MGGDVKILVIGSGGREHAIAKKFSESPRVEKVYCAPGNAGMKRDKIELVPISELDNAALVDFARTQQIDLTFVGPETSLMNGIADAFAAADLRIFAPTQAAAEIEGSKEFAKFLMKKWAVPTADYAVFEDLQGALSYVRAQGAPIVVKADGLAAGKGVTVALDLEAAEAALLAIFSEKNAKVVIEEYLEGEEFSLFSFVHEGRVWPMPIAQDHKRAFDGDKGANTGGMGAYSPVAQIPESAVSEALEKVVKPVVAGLMAEGRSFTGVLYAGLMLTADGVKTIEFNARFGDPETQVVLPRLTSDLAQAIMDILDGREPELVWLGNESVTLGVVMASSGYPESSTKGLILPEIPNDWQVYYAGVAENEAGQLVSNGGRVYLLAETALNVAQAQKLVYDKLDGLDNTGFFYRHDIGSKALRCEVRPF
ncbi:phosphoribosylamine--glycine ligase [Lactovum odontotermitis]